MSDDTTTSSELATVAGELYRALLEARSYVSRASTNARPIYTAEQRERAAERLERIDAVLADAADYIGAVA